MNGSQQDLQQVMSSGLLSFPVTDFDASGNFNAAGFGAIRKLYEHRPYPTR